MTQAELDLLKAQLLNSSHYLEFGAGGSTKLAVQTKSIKTITTVESDVNYWEYLLSHNEIKNALLHKRLKFIFANIGEIEKWGYPVDSNMEHKWPNYSSKPFKKGAPIYDLILVDGRFRIACILHACLNASSKTSILVHDFFNRPQYFVVLPFLTLLEKADTMALFKIRKKNDIRIIKKFIAIYQYYPGF